MMMPPTTATRARTAMIQLVLPSRSLWPSTAEAARAAGAADAPTGAASTQVAARETAASLSRFIIFSVHWITFVEYQRRNLPGLLLDRKRGVEAKRESVRVDLGGGRR